MGRSQHICRKYTGSKSKFKSVLNPYSLYIKTTGLIVFNLKKAPLLKANMPVLLELPPSGYNQTGEYSPYSSTRSYLSPITFMLAAFLWTIASRDEYSIQNFAQLPDYRHRFDLDFCSRRTLKKSLVDKEI